ncbi:hypothetical protein SAMN02799616_00471 [Paenibacillus sp. UNC499MF]|nr:hypothetical protein SAMN02799616_00471 [Paenibacillus sp. UNC499MF]
MPTQQGNESRAFVFGASTFSGLCEYTGIDESGLPAIMKEG